MSTTTQTPPMSVDGLIAWAKQHAHLGVAVLRAQAFAMAEKERVEAYTRPIFDRYNFRITAEKHPHAGKPVPDDDSLYLCDDERIPAYYAECAVAHRAHGWKGNPDHCPALVADHDRVKAECDLLEAAAKFMGIDHPPYKLELRDQMLKLMLGVTLKAANETGLVQPSPSFTPHTRYAHYIDSAQDRFLDRE